MLDISILKLNANTATATTKIERNASTKQHTPKSKCNFNEQLYCFILKLIYWWWASLYSIIVYTIFFHLCLFIGSVHCSLLSLLSIRKQSSFSCHTLGIAISIFRRVEENCGMLQICRQLQNIFQSIPVPGNKVLLDFDSHYFWSLQHTYSAKSLH